MSSGTYEVDAVELGRLVNSHYPLSVGGHAGTLAVLCLRIGAMGMLPGLLGFQATATAVEVQGSPIPPSGRFEDALEELAALRLGAAQAILSCTPFQN